MCGWVVVVKMYSPILVNMQRPFSSRIRICEKKEQGERSFFCRRLPFQTFPLISGDEKRREKGREAENLVVASEEQREREK